MLLLLSVSLLIVAFVVFATRGSLRRAWRGSETRLFEREWDLRIHRDRFYFAIPSYKTAYYEIRPGSPFTRLRRFLSAFFPSPIEREFEFRTEDPRLAEYLSSHDDIIISLQEIRELGSFHILSTGQELHGWFKFKKTKMPKDLGSALLENEIQKLLSGLEKLLEVQFDLPLNEMSPLEIQGWRRSSALPFVMLTAGFLISLLQFVFFTGDESFQSGIFKMAFGLSIFSTGLGLLWGAFRAPPHDFSRMALSYLLVFSWSAFLWTHGIFVSFQYWQKASVTSGISQPTALQSDSP